MKVNWSSELDQLGVNLDREVVKEADSAHRCFAICGHDELGLFFGNVGGDLGAGHWPFGVVLNEQAFDAVLLNEDVDACLGDAHDDCLHRSDLNGLGSEELESVELDAGLWGQLSKSILSVHLVALLGHLEFVSHIIWEGSDVNCSC